MKRLSEDVKIDVGLEAQSLNGTATGEYFNMGNYRRGLFVLQGADLGEGETVKIEVLQATDADGSDSKALKDINDNAVEATITAQTDVTEVQIDLSSSANTDTVTVNGVTYTQAASTSIADKEFTNDDGLAQCINDESVGVEGIEASASSDVVTVKAEDPGDKLLTVSATENSGTVGLSTVSAIAYVDIQTSLIDNENNFSHLAAKITTGAAQNVSVDYIRYGSRYMPNQKVAASSTV